MHPQLLLSKAQLRDSLEAIQRLLKTARLLRTALINLAHSTGEFARALQDCARLKGTQQEQQEQHHNPAQRLMAASGLHFISANLHQLLSKTIKDCFESPLSSLLESYQNQLNHQQTSYQAIISLKTQAIRQTELRNFCSQPPSTASHHHPNHRSPRSPRDLDSFRKGLKELQDQVDSLESLKVSYYQQVALGEQEVWNQVAEIISLVIKSEVEVYDRIASKPTSDPTLEAMVSVNPDPFDTYKPLSTQQVNTSEMPEIYSILDPLSNLISSRSPSKPRRSPELTQSTGSDLQPFEHRPSPTTSLCSIDSHSQLNAASHWASQSEPLLPVDHQPLISLDEAPSHLSTAPLEPPHTSTTQPIHDSEPSPPTVLPSTPLEPPHTSTTQPIHDPEPSPPTVLPSTTSSQTVTSPPSPSSHPSPVRSLPAHCTRRATETDEDRAETNSGIVVDRPPMRAHRMGAVAGGHGASKKSGLEDASSAGRAPTSSRSITDSSLEALDQFITRPSALPVPRFLLTSSLFADDPDNLLRERPPSGIDLSDSDV